MQNIILKCNNHIKGNEYFEWNVFEMHFSSSFIHRLPLLVWYVNETHCESNTIQWIRTEKYWIRTFLISLMQLQMDAHSVHVELNEFRSQQLTNNRPVLWTQQTIFMKFLDVIWKLPQGKESKRIDLKMTHRIFW